MQGTHTHGVRVSAFWIENWFVNVHQGRFNTILSYIAAIDVAGSRAVSSMDVEFLVAVL